MKFISLFLRCFKQIKPRYLLSLDSQFYSVSQKTMVYRFKVFGEHTFPKFSFEDIINDKGILYDIHPLDLMKLTQENYISSQKNSVLSISEMLRDNKYKLVSRDFEEVLSGDEICSNPLLIEKIKSSDLYKIAYNTGFDHGRQLMREIQNIDCNEWKNVVPFQIVEK